MIKIFELFAGIGAIRKAFIDSHIPFDVVGISEIDKFAIQSYNSLYGETKNYGDISQIDSSNLPDFDMLIFGFPCQDISIAGKQNGLDENRLIVENKSKSTVQNAQFTGMYFDLEIYSKWFIF